MNCEDCKFYGISRGRDDAGLYLCLRYPNYVRKQTSEWCGEFSLRMTTREENEGCVASAFNTEKVRSLIRQLARTSFVKGFHDAKQVDTTEDDAFEQYVWHKLYAELSIDAE